MDNQTSSYSPTPPYISQHQSNLDGTWDQYGSFAFSPSGTHSRHAPPFFQYPRGSFQTDGISGKGPMTQLLSQIHPSSHVRAYNPGPVKMPSCPNASKQPRKQRAKPTQISRTGPNLKRQKVIPHPQMSDTGNTKHKRCESATGSQSECCSSCPDSPPCDESDCCAEPECDMQAVAVVPCYEQSCEKPVCSNPCLTSGIRAQVAMGQLPIQSRTTNWLESQWIPQIPRGMAGTNMIDPAITAGFETQYASASASPAPTTPSMVQNIETPYSPNTALPTPQFAGFSAQSPYHNQSTGVLSGTGAVFNPSDWQNYASDANASHMISCLWNGCEEQSFVSEQQWLSHLHSAHVDPQMTFGCPIQGETCPQTIDTNPLDHLQTDHGYNFDLDGSGFSCPAPTCLPSETFFTPSLFHNHFDHVHGIPAQGSLQCRLETCNTSFVDPQDLISHINQHHKLPVTLPKDDDIDLSVPDETASILASLPKAASVKVEVPPTTDVDTDFSGKEIVHACKWKSDLDAVCGKISNSEEDLQKHIKHEHLEQLDKNSGYKCQWEGCSRDSRRGAKSGFSQRGKLERHMATHTGFKCCACEECGKTFSAEQSLRQHLLLHKGEKPWKCKHCGKGFPQQSACTIHERTHTKEKPLECTICGKRFSESSNLSKHRKIHGEKGLNSCDFPGCGKSFHRFDQLKRHRATHERQMAKLRGSAERSSGVKTESEVSE